MKFCPYEKCPHYSKATQYPRACYYEPQCWRGYLDVMLSTVGFRFSRNKKKDADKEVMPMDKRD